jgi:outer membrane protein assembly factor BamB
MNLDFILRGYGGQVGRILFLAALGLLLLLAGAIVLLRRTRKGGAVPSRPVFALFLLLLGAGLVGFTGLVIWNRPHAFLQFLQTDYDDPEQLAQLKTADLGSPDRPLAPAGAWPQWRGPNRDGISSETGLNTDWTKAAPPVRWQRPLGQGYSSIAVAGGRLYTQDRQGEEERVLCLDADTGQELWVYRYPIAYAGFISHATGPRATPTVHDGRVYTVGATGILLCLEALPEGGPPRLLWRHELLAEFDAKLPDWGVACSPLIEGDLVCVQPGGSNGSVAAFDRHTGRLVWTALSDPSGYSSPVAATAAGVRQIICFTGKGLAGLRPADGSQLWY